MSTFRRSSPLTREDRRAAIARATVPLLAMHGVTVTTRQIAAAAGVAEGTLFRAFADKDELLRAAALTALDPASLVVAVQDLPDLPVRETIVALARTLQAGMRQTAAAMAAAHAVLADPAPDAGQGASSRADRHRSGHGAHARDAHRRSVDLVVDAIAERLARFPDDLRADPQISARVLFSLVAGLGPPQAVLDGMLDPELIADVALGGLCSLPPGPPSARADRPPAGGDAQRCDPAAPAATRPALQTRS